MKKKVIIILLFIIVIFSIIYGVDNPYTEKARYFIKAKFKYYISFKKVTVSDEYSRVDKNKNGIFDPLDLVNEARKEAENKKEYKNAYYKGGYPPENEGVCTDVIWRAMRAIDVDFKSLLDEDIKKNVKLYPRVNNKPDANIDFRRVSNMDMYLKRHAISLTTDIIPGDIDNLSQWQPGDILVILKPYHHIGIVSDKRGRDGVPYIIHNTPPHAVESSNFDLWICEISGHYRWRYSD